MKKSERSVFADSDIQSIRDEIEQMNGLIAGAMHSQELLNKELEALEHELVKEYKKKTILQKSRQHHKNRYNEIINSRSWKLLKPARVLGGVFRNKNRVKPISSNGNVKVKSAKEKKGVNNNRGVVKQLSKKEDASKRKIARIRKKVLNLGFEEKGVEELKALIVDKSKPTLSKLAAWELLQFYSNKSNETNAEKSLEIIEVLKNEVSEKEFLQKISIMEAENLEVLGKTSEAKEVVGTSFKYGENANLFFSMANLEKLTTEKIKWINKALEIYSIPKLSINPMKNSIDLPLYDRLEMKGQKRIVIDDSTQPKVTVIMPVYNASDVIRTSMESVLLQSWTNLELIVVDDCSTDSSVDIVKEYMKRDRRVRLLSTRLNSGPYVARNIALDQATGDFITCNDADDWSHPIKIETQVKHLIDNPNVLANTSEQARATNELKLHRRGRAGEFIFANMSSLLFRRDLINKIGYWDSVRFVADGEFIRRIKRVCGNKSVVHLSTGPLSFQRQLKTSLTGNDYFGYHGFLMGARKEYFDAYNYYHEKTNLNKLYIPKNSRLFAVPEPLMPQREAKRDQRRHFDVILVSDYRLAGGSNMSNVEEIKAQKRLGLKIGLIQLNRYDFDPGRKIISQIRELLDDTVQFIVYGEKVSCDLLVLRYPPILQELQIYIPDVEAKHVRVIINQPPFSDYGPDAVLRYELACAQKNLETYFGKKGVWHPIGPLVREALYEHHAKELTEINLDDTDWSNIIDLSEWRRTSHDFNAERIRIGRHSRDHEVKWPGDAKELLEIYPSDEQFEIHVLGGAETPRNVLGYLPNNWTVFNFGEMHPKDFLLNVDVFVYFTHEDWVEAFGRVIIEAMAVGIPVILPHDYYDLFKDAAIYAYPHEVKDKIGKLLRDKKTYQDQVNRAVNYVEENFGYTMHANRIERFIG